MELIKALETRIQLTVDMLETAKEKAEIDECGLTQIYYRGAIDQCNLILDDLKNFYILHK